MITWYFAQVCWQSLALCGGVTTTKNSDEPTSCPHRQVHVARHSTHSSQECSNSFGSSLLELHRGARCCHNARLRRGATTNGTDSKHTTFSPGRTGKRKRTPATNAENLAFDHNVVCKYACAEASGRQRALAEPGRKGGANHFFPVKSQQGRPEPLHVTHVPCYLLYTASV